MFPQSFFTYRRPSPYFGVEEKEERKDYFSQLPDELIIKILKFLPQQALGNCAEVSSKFNRLVKDESIWENIDALAKCLTPEATTEIFLRKPLYLRLAQATIADPMGLPLNFMSPQLLYLDLSLATVEPSVVAKILQTTSSLIKCSFEGLELSSEAMLALHRSCNTLTTLNFTLCSVTDGMGMVALLACCTNLRSLNLGCLQHNWTDDVLLSIVQSISPTVEQLNFAGFRNVLTDRRKSFGYHYFQNLFSIRDSDSIDVSYLVQSIPNVTDLDLSDAQLITGSSIYMIAENLKAVQHLAFSRCYLIKLTAYGRLACLPSLRHLEIFTTFRDHTLFQLKEILPEIGINECPFSPVARPTIANQRNTIWGKRIRYYR